MPGKEIMSTTRIEISKKNPYYLPKHRMLELIHFCLQYKDWKELYSTINGSIHGDEHEAVLLADLSKAMDLIKNTSFDTDPVLSNYIFLSVTESVPYYTLRCVYDIPCGKEYFYQTRRRFFWLLSDRKGI